MSSSTLAQGPNSKQKAAGNKCIPLLSPPISVFLVTCICRFVFTYNSHLHFHPGTIQKIGERDVVTLLYPHISIFLAQHTLLPTTQKKRAYKPDGIYKQTVKGKILKTSVI